MIGSIQKIIKIGSSQGVNLPAKDLKRNNINIGDEVEVIIKPVKNRTATYKEAMDALYDFMSKYDEDLKNLANK